MISGRQTLGSIDPLRNRRMARPDRLQAEIGELTQQLMAQQTAQTDDYRQLAQVRLDRLSGEDLTAQLDRTERQVIALLAQRDATHSLRCSSRSPTPNGSGNST